jgi:hypothetical protein
MLPILPSCTTVTADETITTLIALSMSYRHSIAPSSRRGQEMLNSSLSLSSSQLAGPSSQSAFSFRPHILLSQGHNNIGNRPMLDYSDLTERIETFKEIFSSKTEQMMQDMHHNQTNYSSRLREEKRNIESTEEAIERQREEQKKLNQSESHFVLQKWSTRV